MDQGIDTSHAQGLRVLSLFSGIGGLDLGLHEAGHEIVGMCESWEPARRVLASRFPDIDVADDVATFVPDVKFDALAAGFPCTDLSHAGGKAGIFGPASGLVAHVFRISKATIPRFIVLENVPNLLRLHNGIGMAHVISELEALGYKWAYRTVDTRFTGVPQRRPRVIIVAARDRNPEAWLLKNSVEVVDDIDAHAYGFYWTEGRNGLGFVAGSTPTLKGGSTLGLPSAPAVWVKHNTSGRRFLLPSIEDGEVLQGLPRGWTDAAVAAGERNLRWKLIGNAVTTGVGRWIGEGLSRLADESDSPTPLAATGPAINRTGAWPSAGYGSADGAFASPATQWPHRAPRISLEAVVGRADATPLSYRATRGFLSRLDESRRQVDGDFYRDLEEHLNAMRPTASEAGSKRSTAQALERELGRAAIVFERERRLSATGRDRFEFVMPHLRIAVDLRQCFWHKCPVHHEDDSPRAARWALKRDRLKNSREAAVARATEDGWQVLTIWEHEEAQAVAARIGAIVRARCETRAMTNSADEVAA